MGIRAARPVARDGSQRVRETRNRAPGAPLYSATRIGIDGVVTVFILDASNNCVRKVTSNGTITTIAGNGVSGFGGNGGPATNASLFLSENPLVFAGGLALDGGGNLYISDSENNGSEKSLRMDSLIL
jgi:hypothetical protein